MIDAVRDGDVAEVRALLAGAVDPDQPSLDGTTPLHWAANRDDLDSARLLLGAGARADVVNRYGATPLLVAATNGGAEMLEMLLAAGADPNAGLPEGETPLMRAARAGRAGAVRALLRHGAEVDAAERWRGQTALMWAAIEGNTGSVLELVAGGADVHARSAGGFTPLLFAVRHDRRDVLRVLAAAGADVDDTLPDGMSALCLATLNAHYDTGVWLLEQGADPKAAGQGWTALHQLVWARRPNLGFNNPAPIPTGLVSDLDFVRVLADHGADLDARQRGGGFLAPLSRLTRWGLAGPAASGRQWWPWVHLDDVVGLILHALDSEAVQGPVNVCAPAPARQRDLAKALGRVLRRPAIAPAPSFALRLALGGFASELLNSRRTLPAAALASGYAFRHPDLAATLRDIYS